MGRRLVRELPRLPVISSALAAERVGVSERAARTALDTLARHGIVSAFEPAHSQSRYRWWQAPDVLALIGT